MAMPQSFDAICGPFGFGTTWRKTLGEGRGVVGGCHVMLSTLCLGIAYGFDVFVRCFCTDDVDLKLGTC